MDSFYEAVSRAKSFVFLEKRKGTGVPVFLFF